MAANIITTVTACISWLREAATDAITIVIGPVGPDIIGILEPRSPATKHRIIAPQMPAPAPNPVATPNARACGRATIAEFSPPNISPVKICNLDLMSITGSLAEIIFGRNNVKRIIP